MVLLLILKEFKVRHSVLFSAAAVLFFFFLSLSEMREVLLFLREISSESGFSSYFNLLLRALGIALCTGFLAEFCRDLGEGTLSRAAELCGKGAILSLTFPLLKDFLELIRTCLNAM